MEHKNALDQGLLLAAWGLFFTNIDVKIGAMDFHLVNIGVVPRFVGFLLLLAALIRLSEGQQEMERLKPLAALLAVWYGADWMASSGRHSLGGQSLLLDFLVLGVRLYFLAGLLTGLAALAEELSPELSGNLRRGRSIFLALWGALIVLSLLGFCLAFPGDIPQMAASTLRMAKEWAWALVGLAGLVVLLLLMRDIFRLRRQVKASEPGEGSLDFNG